jgi:hypothetical protein
VKWLTPFWAAWGATLDLQLKLIEIFEQASACK